MPYANPWTLPPLPEGYGQPIKQFKKRPRKPLPLTLRQANALLNLGLACCAVFLTLVFPVLLHRNLTGSDAVLGWRFVVVTSGAMEPDIRCGALLLAKESPFRRLEEGDVIVYETGGDRLFTRRVVALEHGTAVTKGDAAPLPEAVPVTPEMYKCQVRKVFNGFAWVMKGMTE